MSTHTDRLDDADLVPIGIASTILSVSPSTVRRYEAEGKVTATRTLGNQRRYRVGDLRRALATAAARTERAS